MRVLIAGPTVRQAIDYGRRVGLSPRSFSPVTERSIRGVRGWPVVILDHARHNPAWMDLFALLQANELVSYTPTQFETMIHWFREFSGDLAPSQPRGPAAQHIILDEAARMSDAPASGSTPGST